MSRIKIFSLKDKRYFAGVDFGQGDDIAVYFIWRNNGDGTTKLVEQKILGKTKDFDKEKRENVIEEIKNFKFNDELKND